MPGSIRIATAPALNSRKHQRNEIDARADQQGQPRAGRDAQRLQSAGDPVAVLVQLAERHMPVAPLALGVVSQRLDHGDGLGPGLGHLGEPPGDVQMKYPSCPHHGKLHPAVQCPHGWRGNGGVGYA